MMQVLLQSIRLNVKMSLFIVLQPLWLVAQPVRGPPNGHLRRQCWRLRGYGYCCSFLIHVSKTWRGCSSAPARLHMWHWPSSKEKKPTIVNNQCVVCKFECDLCEEDNVRYAALHLHQRINEHKCSAIGRHLEQHGLLRSEMIDKQFSVLKKCRSKFDCLNILMLFIKELNSELNTHKNSIRANLFTWLCVRILCYLHIITLLPVSLRNSFTFIKWESVIFSCEWVVWYTIYPFSQRLHYSYNSQDYFNLIYNRTVARPKSDRSQKSTWKLRVNGKYFRLHLALESLFKP